MLSFVHRVGNCRFLRAAESDRQHFESLLSNTNSRDVTQRKWCCTCVRWLWTWADAESRLRNGVWHWSPDGDAACSWGRINHETDAHVHASLHHVVSCCRELEISTGFVVAVSHRTHLQMCVGSHLDLVSKWKIPDVLHNPSHDFVTMCMSWLLSCEYLWQGTHDKSLQSEHSCSLCVIWFRPFSIEVIDNVEYPDCWALLFPYIPCVWLDSLDDRAQEQDRVKLLPVTTIVLVQCRCERSWDEGSAPVRWQVPTHSWQCQWCMVVFPSVSTIDECLELAKLYLAKKSMKHARRDYAMRC